MDSREVNGCPTLQKRLFNAKKKKKTLTEGLTGTTLPFRKVVTELYRPAVRVASTSTDPSPAYGK